MNRQILFAGQRGSLVSLLVAVGSLVVLFSLMAPAQATLYGTPAPLSGTRTAGNPGLVVNDDDWDDIVLEWDITNNGNGTFDYLYTISGLNKPGLSHLTLDISDDAINDPNVVTTPTLNGQSIPVEIDDLIDGITGAAKLDEGADGTVVYRFTSNRSPVFGDVRGKGGNSSIFYNSGFGNQTLLDPLHYVARPNGPPTDPQGEIPEPATWLLLAGSLVVVTATRHRR